MQAHDEVVIRVQSEWNGWRTAEVRLRDLENVHWLQPSRAPQPLVHGYILCRNITTGEVPHDCDSTSAPHRLLVCVLKRHMIPTAYAELARRADEQRTLPPGERAVTTGTSEIRSQRMAGPIPSSLS
jgi:hypothetical protein